MIENAGACKADVAATLKGLLKICLSYTYLASLHFYRQVHDETAHLSYVMRTRSSLITDVIDVISNTKRKLGEIAESPANLPFESRENHDGAVTITAKATNIPTSVCLSSKCTN